QQRSGLRLAGGVGRVGDPHERHAEAVADRVVRGHSAADLLQRYARPQDKEESCCGVQRLPLTNTPKLAGQWFVNPIGGQAYEAEAWNLIGVPGKSGASRPAAKPASWTQYQKWGMVHPGTKPGYVRMHLMNDRLGGSGKMVTNLAPGSNWLNRQHDFGCERPLVRALKSGGFIDEYRVTVDYNGPSGNLATKKGKAAWRNAIDTVKCRAKYKKNVAKGKWIYMNRTLNERGGLDNKLNWSKH
ncbi:MAG: hypothetical protein ABT940_03790, partial [Alphaproteobacteria bacterium]